MQSTSAVSPLSADHSVCHSLVADRYLLLEQMEASSLYRCVDRHTLEEFVCKVVPSSQLHDHLKGYLLLDGNPRFNSIVNVLVAPEKSYILFAPSFGDLHSYVRNVKRLREPEAARLFHQIASIVADCHRNGIVLRDLKLRKFVFKDAERTLLKLETLDDAIVLEDSEDDRLSDKHGCPAYVSPEILYSSKGQYSGKTADCWSLGVILFTMLVGRYPFHDSDPSLLFCKIRRGSFHIPNSLSPLAKCLIRSLLRKEPSERLTAEELLDCKWFKLMSSPNSGYCKYHNSLNSSENPDANRPPFVLLNSCQTPFLIEDKIPADQTVPDLAVSEDTTSSLFCNGMSSVVMSQS
ncbi:serine/threonine protein kinase-like protein [Dinothrombium tinctorium]|uniref:Serine/threonine protein kinase-like protein n=1 Tax=Dinothrombium tinctorium TaxID=1965070 RepID=A0A3S3SGX8_9ACAR|nr:serine/threonine protein kinase-like protein [Dinothrombium tinctorium]